MPSVCNVSRMRTACVKLLLFFLAVISAPAAGQPAVAAVPCESLGSLSLPYTTITSAQPVAAGAFVAPGATGAAAQNAAFKSLPNFCRVTATVKPSRSIPGTSGNFKLALEYRAVSAAVSGP